MERNWGEKKNIRGIFCIMDPIKYGIFIIIGVRATWVSDYIIDTFGDILKMLLVVVGQKST